MREALARPGSRARASGVKHQHPRPAGDAAPSPVCDSRCRIGSAKAARLAGAPVCVDAAETTRPARIGAMHCFWIGVGWKRPSTATALKDGSPRAKSRTGSKGHFISCFGGSDAPAPPPPPKRCRKTTRANWAVWLRANEDRGRVSLERRFHAARVERALDRAAHGWGYGGKSCKSINFGFGCSQTNFSVANNPTPRAQNAILHQLSHASLEVEVMGRCGHHVGIRHCFPDGTRIALSMLGREQGAHSN